MIHHGRHPFRKLLGFTFFGLLIVLPSRGEVNLEVGQREPRWTDRSSSSPSGTPQQEPFDSAATGAQRSMSWMWMVPISDG